MAESLDTKTWKSKHKPTPRNTMKAEGGAGCHQHEGAKERVAHIYLATDSDAFIASRAKLF